jgi:hypothetical protein
MNPLVLFITLLLISPISAFLQDTLSHEEKQIQYLDSEFGICSKDSATYQRYAIFCPNGVYLYIDHRDFELVRNSCSMVKFEEGVNLLVNGEIIFYYKNKRIYEIDTYKDGYLQSTRFYKRDRLREVVVYDFRNNVNNCSCSVYVYNRKGQYEFGNWSLIANDEK